MIAHAETRRFTAGEYHKLAEAGILEENDRVELLDGEIIVMAPIGRHHAAAVRWLNRQLNQLLADVCVVDCQNAFELDEFSEPQPDILLVKLEFARKKQLPRPEDIYVAIEVADTTLQFDTTAKLAAYARGGIQEYWIVNLTDACVDIYRRPQGGRYGEHFRRRSGESVAPAAFPDRVLHVAEMLP